MIGGPLADLIRPAAKDRDVERIDLDLHELLRGTRSGRRGEPEEAVLGDRIGFANEALEGPVAALLDLRGDPGEWRQRAERPTATGELERRDVVLIAVVVARQRRGP
jgi:hypothetical protein